MVNINTKNWQYFFKEDDFWIYNGYIDMTDFPSYDTDDVIDVKKSKYTTQIVGGKGNDHIYGSTNHMNFLYGDLAYEIFGTEEDNKNYFNIKGNDIIYGGNSSDYINAGAGNDTICGRKGINIFSFIQGDGIDNIIMNSGKDYLYFVDTSFDNMKIERKDYDLIIKYGNKNDSITVENYFKKISKSSLKGIFDMKADTTSIERTFYAFYETTEKQAINQIKQELIKSKSIVNLLSEQNFIYTEMSTSGKFNGTDYNDKIIGTSGIDKLYGGKGNDIIIGGKGDDNITGGIGKNEIIYTIGDNNDIINLTKGENFTLNIEDVSDIKDLKFEFANKNKDLRIYTQETEYITIKNFAKKDITNTYTKRNPIDTSSVELNINDKTYNLRDAVLSDGTYLYKISLGENAKNYTGTWLNDFIDAQNVKLYKTQGKGKNKKIIERNVSDTGLTLKGGLGNDKIIGSKYSDKIYGNKGNDIINTGTGKNYIYFSKGDGNDIVENSDGNDIIIFSNLKKINQLNFSYDKITNDLTLIYSNNDTVTIENYDIYHSVQTIKIGKKEYNISELLFQNNIDINSINEQEFNIEKLKSSVESWKINNDFSEIGTTFYNDNNSQLNEFIQSYQTNNNLYD
ncbi:hypothetical protein J6O48_10855 [bacterium]|nr:hypothetical protein [bacterium]